MTLYDFIPWLIASATGVDRVFAGRRHARTKAKVLEAEAAKLEADKKAAEAEAAKLRADAENIVGQTYREAMKSFGEELARVRAVAKDLERQNGRQQHQIELRGREVQDLKKSVAGLRDAHGACEAKNAQLEAKQTELGMQVQSQQAHITQMEMNMAGLKRELDAARAATGTISQGTQS